MKISCLNKCEAPFELFYDYSNIVEDIFIGIILSILFHFIVNHIPRMKDKRNVYNVINAHIWVIIAKSFDIFLYMRMIINKFSNIENPLDFNNKEISIKDRFEGLYQKFPMIVFNSKDNYTINVQNENSIEIEFQVSEHYDYSSDKKLKEYMITESIRAFQKLSDLENITLSTSYNGNNYKISLVRNEIKSYIEVYPKVTKNELENIWTNYSLNK